jgi:GR25 family glycosyltransferase involved in LPS biosynthesis
MSKSIELMREKVDFLIKNVENMYKMNSDMLYELNSLKNEINKIKSSKKNFKVSDYIDMVFYINLDSRSDRKEDIEKELNEYELNYERIPAVEISYFGALGASYSHLNALCIAKERGYKNILIMEDDFTFTVSKDEFENEMEQFFTSNIDYDVCLLSYNLENYCECEKDFLYKIQFAQTASGYLVNEKYYDLLIENFRESSDKLGATWVTWVYAVDVYWKHLQIKDNWYCFKNRIGVQKASYSDIRKDFVDYNC